MGMHRAVIVLAALLTASPSGAATVRVTDAWFRALPSKLPAGGYFTLYNYGAAVQLKGVESPACGMLMLHKSGQVDGMETMMMIPSVDIPAGGTVAFSPGAYHLMCTDPTPAMTPGAQVPVTFKFSDGTTVTATFAVRNASGK